MKEMLQEVLDELKYIHKKVDIIENFVLGDLITEPVETNIPFPKNLMPDSNGYSYIEKE